MKTTSVYVCSFCGNSSENKEYIKQCEASHPSPILVEKVTYTKRAMFQKHPDKLEIRFSDGSTAEYTIDGYFCEGLDSITD